METKSISRRDLLKSTGVLIVGFSFFGTAARALAQGDGLSVDGMDPTVLDSWMAIAKGGTVTVFTGKVEVGTGVVTALAQIVAEELDVRFDKVYMESGDTDKAVDQGVTAAARTIERGGVQLRQASAAARQELLKLASARLDSPVDKLTVTDGVVSVVGNPAKKIAYGDLLGGKRFNIKIVAAGVGWDMKVAPEVPAKNPKDYKIVGKSIPRVDLPEKFTGEFVYSQDAGVPGMLHGRVVRPATSLSAPASVDESSIKNIPGVVKVVREGTFVGVVAETEWAAIQAARTLKVSWSEPTLKMMSGPTEVFDYLKNTKSFKDNVITNRGNLDAAFSQAQKKYEATYYWPFQLHGMMGPPCALADVRGDKATIWTGTQGPFRTRDAIAKMLSIPPKNVQWPLRTSNLRAPGDLARVFASESTIDEIAADLHVDPVQFRLRYLTSDKRISEILVATAKKAGWTDRPSPAPASTGAKAAGRGVAVANRANTMTAAVAEIEVDKTTGDVTVKKITLAHDCGLIVNPDGLKNQIEGNILQAVSRALLEEVQFDSTGQKNLDWDSYPVIRFEQVPDVEIVLIDRPEMQPLGGGEPSIVPVTAAIANAIFDATGARMRQVPFTPQRVLSALKA